MTDITYFNGLSLEENIKHNFTQAGKIQVWAHTLQVRHNALNLAQKFGISPEQASSAALLHDISRIFAKEEYLELAQIYDLEILAEERQLPDLLHQKLSRVIAVESFNITDKEVLNAISCHTTLRAHATKLDKILFLADKLSWSSQDLPAFTPLVIKQLEKSLDDGVYCYLFNSLYNSTPMPVVHPWLKAALQDLTPVQAVS